MIEKDSIVKFDFNRMNFTSYKKNNFNINIDNKFPTYIIDENLYFMSLENEKNALESINLNSLDSSGISWFEARAFAKYSNLSLPNVYQWLLAS